MHERDQPAKCHCAKAADNADDQREQTQVDKRHRADIFNVR